MTIPFRPESRRCRLAWRFVLFFASVLLISTNYLRMARVDYVSGIDREDVVVDPSSPTGYAGGKRWLIVPERNLHSYEWISQTQQMLAQKTAWLRRVTEENAPYGREVFSPSPYRWWLALLAKADQAFSGRPTGLSVEHAALFADPLLHLLLLGLICVFVARNFGGVAASITAIVAFTLFPFAGSFLPGSPNDLTFSLGCAVGSILPLLAALSEERNFLSDPASSIRRRNLLFSGAGVLGGFGLWISVAREVPIIVGIALGGIAAAALGRRDFRARLAQKKPAEKTQKDESEKSLPWRHWAIGGAATCFFAYLIEGWPDHLGGFRLQVNHPLYGLAWMGLGEVLYRIQGNSTQTTRGPRWRLGAIWALALIALCSLPFAMVWGKNPGFLLVDPLASRLTFLPNGVVAKNFGAWLSRDGLTWPLIATLLPLLLVLSLAFFSLRRVTAVGPRSAIALSLGPVVATTLLALSQLQWWAMVDAALLSLIVAIASALPAVTTRSRMLKFWAGLVGVGSICGAIALVPRSFHREAMELSRLEVESLIERGLAHTLAEQMGSSGAVILAPPECTASLCFYGGFRGLGTPTWENQEGLAATVLIASATTADEALALINQRGVTRLVLPSWDTDLDEFARLTLSRAADSFIAALHRWALPPWLKPVPYHLPTIAGFEDQAVRVLEVTEEMDRAPALCRAADYFIEMQQLDLAVAAGQVLQQYPADLGALVARAQIEKARADTPAFAKLFGQLVANLSGGFDRALPWDRRVSLAIVLAQGGREDLARKQLQRCLNEIDESRIRSLTPGSLYRLQVLAKTYGQTLRDPKMSELARRLLPIELRDRL